jgi:hypothetical protein
MAAREVRGRVDGRPLRLVRLGTHTLVEDTDTGECLATLYTHGGAGSLEGVRLHSLAQGLARLAGGTG